MIEKIIKEYNSSLDGLCSAQVIENRKNYGINELKKQKKKTFLVRFLLQFKNLMVLVLLFSAIVSLLTNFFEPDGGSVFEAVIIFVIVILNALIGTFQERKAENSIEFLQAKASPHSLVKRDGKIISIASSELVCGDIVYLKAGNIVPADILLIESSSLQCNESSLTGESVNVDKDANAIPTNSNISEQTNKCFSGTIVTAGHATGIVVATGEKSEIGKIASLITTTKKDKTPLEKNIEQISRIITISVLVIVCVVFFLNLFSNKLGFLDSFLTAIALAVAAIPESLPAVITIIMALGVEKLAKHGAIIKNLNSVETLGCCNIICSDKTGTLTQNKMQVESLYFSNKLLSKEDKLQDQLLINCLALSSNVEKSSDGLTGDATEKAIFTFLSLKIENIPSFPKLNELPFNSKDKAMFSLHKIDEKTTLIVKGAYDYLIDKCDYIYIEGENVKLTESHRTKLDKIHATLASSGQRVLAYAYKETKNIKDKNKLCLVCLVGIIDPPRPEAIDAIAECKAAHIKPIMITGDHPDTALAIARTLGIARGANEVLTGSMLSKLSDKSLKRIIDRFSVFARVSPQDKNRIIKILKENGNIVAMTGDGANDAPSIKEADIGVCMGGSGSDVTKSVADVVITDDNYSSVVKAVKQGRTIFSNLGKTLRFLISTNIVEVICIFVVSLMLPKSIFLLPAQILFINLITDSLPAFALGLERPEKDIMQTYPRKRGASLFSDRLGSHIIAEGFIQSLLVLIIFVSCYHKFGNTAASTICFLIICFMQIIHAINCKSTKSIFRTNVINNKVFNLSFILLFSCILLVALCPPLQIMFGLIQLSLNQWLIVALASVSIIPLVELTKLIISWLHKNQTIKK